VGKITPLIRQGEELPTSRRQGARRRGKVVGLCRPLQVLFRTVHHTSATRGRAVTFLQQIGRLV